MRDPVIVEAIRTPVGKRGGVLSDIHPTDLLATTLQTVVERSGMDPALIDDVIVGCALQRGQQQSNIARNAVLGAGLPESIPGTTLDRACGSGQQAISFAAQSVAYGSADVVIAAGIEMMSRVDLGPLFDVSAGPGEWFGERSQARYDGALGPQGVAAEMVNDRWNLTREELDDFAARSHELAAEATRRGLYADHLVPIEVGGEPVTVDEGIRFEMDRARMATLKPAFRSDGAITAANSSQISDGSAAVLIMEREVAERAGLSPMARFRALAVRGDDPVIQFTAVLPAARRALDQAGLSMGDIDQVEVNEAFACVPLMFQRELGVDTERLNPNGGSIAIGHPLGSTGARMMTDLIFGLRESGGRTGMLTICESMGMANSTIIELI